MSAIQTEPATVDDQTPAPAPLRMSYAEYLAWDHEGGLTEWVDGEVIIHMTAKPVHQKIVDFLNRLVGLFVLVMRLGTVASAPITMRLAPGGKAREPDLFFLAAEHAERLNNDELSGPADLAIEIISDDSAARDRTEKFYEYQAGGVRECGAARLLPARGLAVGRRAKSARRAGRGGRTGAHDHGAFRRGISRGEPRVRPRASQRKRAAFSRSAPRTASAPQSPSP